MTDFSVAVPMHSIQAEQSVLGGLLLDSAALARVRDLSPADFYNGEHRAIFEAIRSMTESGAAVDVITVHDALFGKLERDDLFPYLHSLAQNTPSAANIVSYSEIVLTHAKKRALMSGLNDAADRLAKGEDASEILSRLTQLTHGVASSSGRSANEIEFDMGDDLSEVEGPDELVEGVITRGAVSVMYGDSNTGKTFLALDLAAAVARGTPWLGSRRTEGGLVIYLATEGPRSVRGRTVAYQRSKDVDLKLLAIVKSPIDLFASDADATAVVALVAKLEEAFSRRVELIVGDTLSRLSAGANENLGEDMSIVVRNIDRIRAATSAHFLLIHHTGKDAAKGMRGWSGMRAAIDTEIEVTADEATGERAAKITKQRDLAGKGTRIGFRLDVVQLGTGKWGTPITSCVVEPTDAPAKQQRGRRVSEIAGAITEMLTTAGGGVRKTDVVKHFAGRYDHGPVYRELKKLANAGVLLDVAGSVRMAVMP